ncbi:MAG: O-antigen ligase family protein, partial [Hyphomicrobium sp.]
MTSALIIPVHRGAIGAMMPPRHGGRRENAPKSTCHKLVLALVWLTMAISGIVFSEPAPVDLLLAGLLLLLPLVGMTRFPPLLAYGWAIVLIIAAATVLAVPNADDMARAITHGSVTLYLYGAGFVIAGFVAYAPAAHSRLILHAYLAGAVAAALAGIIGYLDLVPGAYDLFTRFSRAAGPFKDPNVYAPYLICPLLTALHIWLTRPLVRGAPYLVAATILAVAILFSFSRGAWAATLLALAIYCYFYMLSASRNFDRLKLAALVLFGTTTVALVLVAALQSDRIALLLQDRFAVTQPYDEGPNGRFGGQMTAIDLILDSPLGIGPNQFAPR